MTSAEICAELRASAPAAPDHLRDRVRTLTALEGTKRARTYTPRRISLVFAGGLVAAALGAALVHGIASGNGTGAKKAALPAVGAKDGDADLKAIRAATSTVPSSAHVPAATKNLKLSAGEPAWAQAQSGASAYNQAVVGGQANDSLDRALIPPSTLPPAVTRLQDYDVSLGVGVKNPGALSKATVRAMKLTRAFGGYVARVSYATPSGKKGESILLLRIPVTRVQDAIQQFSSLGTLTSQHVSIQDLQGTVNAQTKRIIVLNRRIGAILKALEGTLTVDSAARLQSELVARRQELAAVAGAKSTTIREGRLAHVYLTLHTQQAKHHKKAVVVHHKPGRIQGKLDAAGHVLAQELAVLLYGLVVLAPFLLLGAAGVATARAMRRRSDRRLLASQ